MFQEINFDHSHLPRLGPFGGSLDFLTSMIAEVVNLERGDNMVRHVTPYLLVVEAKQESTLKKSSSQIQLITQMIMTRKRPNCGAASNYQDLPWTS